MSRKNIAQKSRLRLIQDTHGVGRQAATEIYTQRHTARRTAWLLKPLDITERPIGADPGEWLLSGLSGYVPAGEVDVDFVHVPEAPTNEVWLFTQLSMVPGQPFTITDPDTVLYTGLQVHAQPDEEGDASRWLRLTLDAREHTRVSKDAVRWEMVYDTMGAAAEDRATEGNLAWTALWVNDVPTRLPYDYDEGWIEKDDPRWDPAYQWAEPEIYAMTALALVQICDHVSVRNTAPDRNVTALFGRDTQEAEMQIIYNAHSPCARLKEHGVYAPMEDA